MTAQEVVDNFLNVGKCYRVEELIKDGLNLQDALLDVHGEMIKKVENDAVLSETFQLIKKRLGRMYD